MIKLSDYLNYLNNEVIQARKMADEQAIAVAKEYAEHEYLKYFRVPRFSMPVVKLNIPIKINELDSSVTYNFKRDYDTFVSEVNEKITKVNQEKGLSIQPLKKEELLKNKNITGLFDRFENTDYKPVKKLEDNLAKIDINKATLIFSKNIRFSNSEDSPSKEIENIEYSRLLKESFANRFTPVKTELKNIFIDPDTSKETDKGKILLTLDVEMVEEGFRIRSLKDKDGKEVEEIIFE
jgi:hypothetical protein